ncbi:MAG: DPP IV N-terminal domain-containing protein [Planctomycetota bacterium]
MDMRPGMHWISPLALASAVVAGSTAGCGMGRKSAPQQQPPRPTLTAARDRQISMFGELPTQAPEPYRSRTWTSLRQHTDAEDGADFDPDLDPTGRRLAFASTRHSAKPNLYVKDVDGRAVTQLTADPSSDVQPSFSPDGRRVAFASDRSGNWDIWLISVDGGQPVQLTQGSGHDVSPSWSPDGRSLVYCSLPPSGGQWELRLADAVDGGAQRFIGYGLFPQWSPVGDTILYQRARQRGSRWFTVWTVELIDGEPRYPTEIASSADYGLILPAFSADGSQVAYCAVSTVAEVEAGVQASADQADVWVVRADGRGRARLTDGLGASFSPTWSRDGRIYFTRRCQGRENIWSLTPPRTVEPGATLSSSDAAGRAPVIGGGP